MEEPLCWEGDLVYKEIKLASPSSSTIMTIVVLYGLISMRDTELFIVMMKVRFSGGSKPILSS